MLLKPAAFLFLIAFGYILKKKGFFGPEDYKIPMKIILNLTLPCAVLVSFSSYSIEPSLLVIILLGFGMNWLMLLIGYLISRTYPRPIRAIWLNCIPSYNVSIFALPFLQSSFGPVSVIAACLFDIGNGIMCNGTTYALSSSILEGTGKINLKSVFHKLSRSVPFISYMIFFIITLCRIPIPEALVTFATPMANANVCLAMLMVGMMLDLRIEKAIIKDVLRIIGVRFAVAIVVALCSYFLLPLPLEIRQTLVIVAFAPISMVTTALTVKAGGNPAMTACTNSLSNLVFIPCVLTFLMIFGVM